jgi:hypothetical protein
MRRNSYYAKSFGRKNRKKQSHPAARSQVEATSGFKENQNFTSFSSQQKEIEYLEGAFIKKYNPAGGSLICK